MTHDEYNALKKLQCRCKSPAKGGTGLLSMWLCHNVILIPPEAGEESRFSNLLKLLDSSPANGSTSFDFAQDKSLTIKGGVRMTPMRFLELQHSLNDSSFNVFVSIWTKAWKARNHTSRRCFQRYPENMIS